MEKGSGRRSFKIGVFDSGFGGLTVFKEIKSLLPNYDYVYLGDNARAPYGPRSFDAVYKYTLQAVKKLFELDCHLVIIACNTASAKALRTIQQNDLAVIAPQRRVLGVIRPCTESADEFTQTGKLGLLATSGTVRSDSYQIEIEKFFPSLNLYQQACPMLVPLVENNEAFDEGADFFVKKYISQLYKQSPDIDAVILACTHYPVLREKIRQFLPDGVRIISQGEVVATKLVDYLQRHSNIERELSEGKTQHYYTTDCPDNFSELASLFMDEEVAAEKLTLVP